MPVSLFPPITSGGTWGTPDADPLLTGPRYVRGSAMSRWHRVRSAFTYRRDRRTVYHLWCGQHAYARPGRPQLVLTVDSVDDELPVCGTCEGRALGAGQDLVPEGMPELRFDPRWLDPPSLCPGGQSLMFQELAPRVGRCLVCGQLQPLRCYGGSPWYGSAGYGPSKHPPGPDLIDPCPWHAWRHLELAEDGTVRCSCAWSWSSAG